MPKEEHPLAQSNKYQRSLTVCPALDEPFYKTLALVALMLLFAVVTAIFMDGVFWGIFAFIILALSLHSYFLLTHYELNDAGISYHRWPIEKHYRWREFARVETDKGGIFLSPFAEPSKLDSFRGVYIRTYKDREDLYKEIKTLLDDNKLA